MDKKLAFIGGGNMAQAIIGGLLDAGWNPSLIAAIEPNPETCEALDRFRIFSDAARIPDDFQPDAVMLAIKPQVMSDALKPHRERIIEERPVVISIAAGITTDALSRWLDDATAIVRVMPNTPALVGLGAAGMFANANVSAAQRELANAILSAVGTSTWVNDEIMIDAVTAVSGSGPAYFFYVIEALEEAAQKLGMDAETARELSLQTAIGAATLARQSDDPPAELRRKVTSPGGTTERALQALTGGGLDKLFERAVRDAFDRAGELAQAADESN